MPDDIHPNDKAAWVFERAREGDRHARTALRRLCLRVPEIRASVLGAGSVALGALRVALDQVDARLFTDGMPAPLTLRA
ncbi:hypothetical protein [Nonomuraea sp. NPDC050783]|uniref:hypothetical protein n=1 Tax=Nonomuraea sp. NPDC050783 TaxID=3154634 RepID=UPI003466696E